MYIILHSITNNKGRSDNELFHICVSISQQQIEE